MSQTSSLSAGNGAFVGVPQGSRFRLAIIALTAFLTVVDLFATQAILPSLARHYGVAPAAMSLAVNASTFGMALASIGMAFLARHLDRRLGILIALAVLTVPTLLLAVAPNLAVFAALRVAQGLCMASAFTLMLAYLGEGGSGGDTASAFAAYIAGNVASNLVGRLISAAVSDHFGLATNFVLFAGLNLAGAVLVYFTVQRTRPVPMATSSRTTPWQAIAGHLRTPGLPQAFAIGFCILFAFIGIFSFVNFVLVRPPLDLGMMSIGFVYFVFAPSIVTTLQAGPLVAKLGTRRALWLGLGRAGFGLPLLLLPSLWLVLVGLALVGIGTFFAQAVATGYVARAARADRGAASGLYLASYFSGGLVGTALLGRLFDGFGWPACVAGVAVALALAAGLATRLTTPASA